MTVSGRCTQRNHGTCTGKARGDVCACKCHNGERTDTRIDSHGGNVAAGDVHALLGERGNVYGYGFAWCAREGTFHIARPDRRGDRYNVHTGTARPRTSRVATYIDVRDTEGNVQRTLAAIAGQAHTATGDDAQARVAVYVARTALVRATLDAQAHAYGERASRH